ncbi:MAG: hypothetical protein ACI8RZ_005077 [Myxococcota bacterium]|jgi:hypothetical protein
MLLLTTLLLSSCKKDAEGTGPPEVCNAGSQWSEGTAAFADATTAWGLYDINAAGVVINAVDFDGDGWTDLAVRSHGGVDDFAEGGARNTWLLRNTGEGQFEDVTESSGILTRRDDSDATGRPGQVWAFGDIDSDGDLDVYTGCPSSVTDCDGQTSEIMLNSGDGTFTLGPDSDVRDGGSPGGVAFVDVDRDGNLDLWVAEYGTAQDHLYKGDGAGGFSDITADAGLTTDAWSSVATLNEAGSHTNAWSALACDLNNDGSPELLAASYGRAPNHLWQSSGGADFVNRSIESGYAFDEGVDWSDNESARCWCMLNPDDEDCTGIPDPEYIACSDNEDAFRWDHTYDREAFRLGGNSGKTACADINNDGWMDLVTTEIKHWDVGSSSDPSELMLNDGATDVTFTRPGESNGITREHDGASWDQGDITNSVFDFDLDGWPDIYIGASEYAGNRGLLYHQTAPEQFAAVPIEDGIDHFRSHGSVVADFDRDGDLDFVVGHSSSRCDSDCYDSFSIRLFENQMGEDANFIQLSLEGGEGTNAAAIGARVSVTAGGVTQTQDVDGGHGHYGNQDDLTLTFGLGEACEADVTVRWPDGALTEQTFTIGGGYRYVVEQGKAPEADL